MAITILQQCSPLQPAYNELIHLLSSTNTAQANFKYICDVYVDGSLVTRLDTPPHPTYGTGLFNPARIIEDYVNKDIDLTTFGFGVNTESNCYYQLKFGESYGASSSGTTAYTNMAQTSNKYVWNAIYDYEDFVGYSSGDINAGGASSRLLTNRPSSGDIQFTEDYYLYAIAMSSGTIDVAVLTTYDSSNAAIATYKIDNPYKANPSGNGRFLRFSAGPNNINQIPTGYIVGGLPQPLITASVAAYEIYFYDQHLVQSTETHRFTINSECSKYESYRIWFLNKLGGYDAFTFYKQNTFNSEIKRETFKSNLGVQTLTSQSYTASQRAVTQYNTKIKDTISCNSNWISEAQSVWLEELVTSPDVYVEKSGVLVPINLLNSNYERKYVVNKHLFNLKIDWQYSYERQRQRF